MAEEDRKAAVYVGWVTFKNAIEKLSQGLPNRIDKTVFQGMAWGVQNQLMAALKFLGLIDDAGTPTAALHALAVPDEAKRKAELNKLLRDRYAAIFALDLMKTTPAQMAEGFTAAYGNSGDSREKAIRFFLSALAYLGTPLSPLIARGAKTGNGTGTPGAPRRRRATQRQKPDLEPEVLLPPPTPTAGTSRVIGLKSGGTLTVSASIDLFKMSTADRSFVFELIDKLDAYEKDNPKE